MFDWRIYALPSVAVMPIFAGVFIIIKTQI